MASQIMEKKGETMPRVEQFAVRLDPQHPSGQYQRAGVRFSTTTDVLFEQVPDVIAKDPWLMVAKVEEGKPPAYTSQERRAKQAGRLI